MSKTKSATAKAPQKGKFSTIFAAVVIPVAFVVSLLIFFLVLGSPSNFEGGDTDKGHPLNYLGTVFKGGPIVPLLITALLTTLTFAIERFLTINAAKGKGSIPDFVRRIQAYLSEGNIDAAIVECDKQRGSVANVVKSGLMEYKEMAANNDLAKDQKLLSVQKAIEEATALEMPTLERNLPIISTIASVGTLIALLGTVLGMIKAFSALATAGAPDAVALSTGISEALINTALGIGTSALSIIFYNYFTARIDGMSYNIEEAGYSMTQTFASQYK
jgi:biopolymer transport protein ExbB